MFSPSIKKIGMFAPAVYGAITAFQFISFVGLWHYKQWGALGFIIVFFSKMYFNISINDVGALFYTYVVISITSLVFIIKHYKHMDPNF